MAVAQGACPGCGAGIEFGVGSSLAKVCSYCGTTVVRSDRGLENMGKVAELANTPCLIAVGDQGTLAGRPFEVLGRVQLDHGSGPWDEFYVGFDHGQSWGWLAYAEGRWIVTTQQPGLQVPPYSTLQLQQDVHLGQQHFRVCELKQGRMVSAEGELPSVMRPGATRVYADLMGQQDAFATIDYGEDPNQGTYEVYTGWVLPEPQLVVSQLGPRHAQEVDTGQIQCPSCGGDVPALAGKRSERLGCPYCGAVSDIATRQIVAQQQQAYSQTEIPIGSKGVFDGVEYIVIAYLRRSTVIEGVEYEWEEYLLWAQTVGFRWLVKDEGAWSWVTPVNLADLDTSQSPHAIGWGGRRFTQRNQITARVKYVLGEVYWRCAVGEEATAVDYEHGGEVLSQEYSSSEVRWSHSSPVAWALLAHTFGLAGAASVQPGAVAAAAAPTPRTGRQKAFLGLGGVGLVLVMCNSCGGCTTLTPTRGTTGYTSLAAGYVPTGYKRPTRYSSSSYSSSSYSGSSYSGSSYGSSSYSGGK